MKVVLELYVDGTPSVDELQHIACRAMEAITGTGGIPVTPRLLLELGPNYLEIPIVRPGSRSKSI